MVTTLSTLADPLHDLTSRAEDLVRQYFYRFMSDHGPSISMIVMDRPPVVVELRAFRTHVVMYRDWARGLMAEADYGQLDAELRGDIATIAEQCDVALEEIDIEANADSKFQRMSQADREEATARTFVSDGAMEEIRARLLFQRRGEPVAYFDTIEHRVTRGQRRSL